VQSGRDHDIADTERSVTIVDERLNGAAEAESKPPQPLRPELQHALRREIEHAIEPVLADFREQSMRAARQQVDADPPAEREQDQAEASSQSEASDLSRSVQRFLDRAGTQWVQGRIEDGRDALCSESVRADVRDSVTSAFRPLIEAGLDLVPGDTTRRALQQESEHALDELIDGALGRFCSERTLSELQRHAEAAIHAFVRFDIATMLREAWAALRTLFRAILAAVQDEWQRLLHFLLHFLLQATKEMIGTLLKDGFAGILAAPVEEVEEKAETAKVTVEEKASELKERLSERLEELRDRVKDEVGKVKERVAEGLQSAVKDGTHSKSFGHPPTGRPPSQRPPSGRPPTGRPPSARPPSGRPPSMTRRNG
jgi:hypothetical protein